MRGVALYVAVCGAMCATYALGQSITPNAFVNLGPGPMFMQNFGDQPVYFVIDTASPSGAGDINDWPQHRLGGDGATRDISINFTQNVYARGRGSVVYSK